MSSVLGTICIFVIALSAVIMPWVRVCGKESLSKEPMSSITFGGTFIFKMYILLEGIRTHSGFCTPCASKSPFWGGFLIPLWGA